MHQHSNTSVQRQMPETIKGDVNSNTVILGDLNTPLSPMERSSKMKINKEAQALNDTLNKLDLIDIYRTVHPKTTEYSFFSCSWNILQDRSYLRYLVNLVNLRKLKSYQVSFLTTML